MSLQQLVKDGLREIPAVVVSAGLMQKTVKVRIGVQKWNDHIKKHFNRQKNLLVHDPNSSLRTGDIISISPGWRTSKRVHHVVNKIMAPFGIPAEERPAVLTLAERLLVREREAKAKEMRQNPRVRWKEVPEGSGKWVKGTKKGDEEISWAKRPSLDVLAALPRELLVPNTEKKISPAKANKQSATSETDASGGTNPIEPRRVEQDDRGEVRSEKKVCM